MKRSQFKKEFKCTGPAVFPVIHVVDEKQVLSNVVVAIGEGAHGVFLINHDFNVETFLPIIEAVRSQYPSLWLGVNFLAVTGKVAFPILAALQQKGCNIDAYWADDARIDENVAGTEQREAIEIDRIRRQCGWQGMNFGKTAGCGARAVC